MAKTSVNTFLSECKIKGDYNVSDDDLTTLLLSLTNDAIKRLGNLFKAHGIPIDTTTHSYFKTIANQEYVDITRAHIVGDATTFTGVAGDLIDVWIDGTEYANINIAACTTIALVVTAINTAVGSTVASSDHNGYLMIQSPTSGATSAVIIEDDALASGAVDSLFSVSAERTQNDITDLEFILSLSERTNDKVINLYSWDDFVRMYPDPAASSASSPDAACLHNGYIYFGPTPHEAIYIYLDYNKIITDVAAGGTMPYDDKYDGLLSWMVKFDLQYFLDNTNQGAMAICQKKIDELIDEMVINAPRQVIHQSESRRDEQPFIRPCAHE